MYSDAIGDAINLLESRIETLQNNEENSIVGGRKRRKNRKYSKRRKTRKHAKKLN